MRNFSSSGLYLVDSYLSQDECSALLDSVALYRRDHIDVQVSRGRGARPLRYSVIDGVQVKEHLPEITRLYGRVNSLVNDVTGLSLMPLENERVGCNVNILGAGNTYRWHYDRNAVTAILYLNEVAGGETECYGNYRISLGNRRFSKLQKPLDQTLQLKFVRGVFGKRTVVAPKTGRLLAMRGDRCLHSVQPVTGDAERINIIMSYDLPGANFAVDERLDGYLYSGDAARGSDPNYL